MQDQQTLIKTGAGNASPQEVMVPKKTQAVRATNGALVEVPHNQFELYDTQPYAQNGVFFTRDASDDLVRANYDANPPNSAEATIITHLGIELTVATIASYAGGGVAADAIDPLAIINALKGGTLYVEEVGSHTRHVEAALGRFMDFSGVQIHGTAAERVVVIPSLPRPIALEEAVYIAPGRGYRIKWALPASAPVITADGYANSGQAVIELRARATHRGSRGE